MKMPQKKLQCFVESFDILTLPKKKKKKRNVDTVKQR